MNLSFSRVFIHFTPIESSIRARVHWAEHTPRILSFSRLFSRTQILLFLSRRRVHQTPAIALDSMMTGQTAANEDASERLAEVGAILAAGLRRLLGHQSSGELPPGGESSLHFSPAQSGGVPPYSPEASHD
jgi:hypothetical protein